ncbi:MAG: YdeI/OmpD-associated family protein [Planctomycetota bacterium]
MTKKVVVTFEGKLESQPWGGSFIRLTRALSGRFPGRGSVRVKGTVGGVPVKSNLMPEGEGIRCLGVHKATIAEGGFTAGDALQVVLELDDAPREVEVPEDFAKALGKHRAAFDALAYSHRREHVDAILEAKKPETRERRIAKAVEMIKSRKKTT